MSITAAMALLQAKHEGITGVTDVNWSVDTTVDSVTNSTEFALTAGSSVDDFYNGMGIVLVDVSDSNALSGHTVSDYVGATKTITLDGTPSFLPMSGDGVKVQAGWPESALSTGNFPQVLVKKGEGSSQKLGGGQWSRDELEVYLFLAKQHQNTYAQATIDANLYTERFREMYTTPANFTLGYSPTIMQLENSEPIADSGLVEIEYLSTIYYGLIFRPFVLDKEV